MALEQSTHCIYQHAPSSNLLRPLCVLTPASQPRPEPPEDERRRRQHRRDAPQQRHGPVDADAVVQRPRGDDHAAGDEVAHHRDARERDRRVVAVAVDDVLVAADVDGDQHHAEHEAGAEPRPDRDGAVVGPAQPEEADGQEGRRRDGGPEAELGLERRAAHVLGAVAGPAV